MNTNGINQLGPLSDLSRVGQQQVKINPPGKDVPSFKDTLNSFLTDVNSLQKKADESIERMAAGEITDVHQVMAASQEATTAFNMMMEIRNKVLDAYQEVMRLRL